MDFKAVLCRICIFVGIKINILTMKKYLLLGLLCCGLQATMAQSALQGTWTGKLKTSAFELNLSIVEPSFPALSEWIARGISTNSRDYRARSADGYGKMD